MTEYTANYALTNAAAERAKWATVLAKPVPTRGRANRSAWRAIVCFFTL